MVEEKGRRKKGWQEGNIKGKRTEAILQSLHTTLHPLIFAICPTADPMAPAAAFTTSVSPSLGRHNSRKPKYAVTLEGMVPSLRLAGLNNAITDELASTTACIKPYLQHTHTLSPLHYTHSASHPGIPRIPKAVEARSGMDGSIFHTGCFFSSLMVWVHQPNNLPPCLQLQSPCSYFQSPWTNGRKEEVKHKVLLRYHIATVTVT